MDIRDMAMPTVAVSIATYKRADSLRKTLDCLSEQKHTDFRDIYVTIVNDGSDGPDYSNALDARFPFDVSYIPRERHEEDKPCVYSCRNLAVWHSKGEVLWLLDDDLRFDEHTLFTVRLYHMLLADQRPVLVPHYADRSEPWHYQNPFPFAPPWPRGHPDEHRLRPWVAFAGLSLWRCDWERVKGIDEAYDGSMGFADMDLGIRLHQDGCNVCLVDGATCYIEDDGMSWRTHFIHKLHPDGVHPNGELFNSRWPEYKIG